jgi:formate-dependent nitrite reductase membrane component NrfD
LYRFYKLFTHLRLQSPMSIGSWLLALFTTLAFTYFWSWLPPESRRRLPRWMDRDISNWRPRLAAIGFPLSIGVAIYTGVLLGAVQARPFWNTNLVAQMFLFSAFSTGCAALLLALSWNRKTLDAKPLRFLYALDVGLITLEFFVVMPYILHGELSVQAVKRSLELILGGPYTLVFWVWFIGAGLLVPLLLEIWEVMPALLRGAAFHHNRRLAGATALLVLGGGYVLRYIFVYAGQASGFNR